MSVPLAIVLVAAIVAITIVAVALIRTPVEGDTSYPTPWSTPGVSSNWTTVRTTRDTCPFVGLDDPDFVKLCTLEAGHEPPHKLKFIHTMDLDIGEDAD